jgi:hypothetical protein
VNDGSNSRNIPVHEAVAEMIQKLRSVGKFTEAWMCSGSSITTPVIAKIRAENQQERVPVRARREKQSRGEGASG